MTTNQARAVWELCRQGLPLAADEAARRWSSGRTFEVKQGVRLARSIRELLDRCNREARRTDRAA